MKLTNLLFTVLPAISSVVAQTAQIMAPAPDTSFALGETFTIQVARFPYIQSMSEVGIALGLQFCPDPSFCSPPSDILGQAILYKGPFDPIRQPGSSISYENFTVAIPNWWPAGTSQIGLGRFAMLGAANAPYTDYLSSVKVSITN